MQSARRIGMIRTMWNTTTNTIPSPPSLLRYRLMIDIRSRKWNSIHHYHHHHHHQQQQQQQYRRRRKPIINLDCYNSLLWSVIGVNRIMIKRQQPFQRRRQHMQHHNAIYRISLTNNITRSSKTITTQCQYDDRFRNQTTEQDMSDADNSNHDSIHQPVDYDIDFPKLPTTLPSFTTTTSTSTTYSIPSQLPDQLPKPIMVTSTLQVGIEQQKKHAIEVWEGVLRQGTVSSHKNDVPQSLPTSISYDDAMIVQQQLKEGYVPPIFHAYTIPEEQRLFHPHLLINTGCSICGGTYDNPNDTPIRLSCQKVIPGQCYDDTIDRHIDFSYTTSHSYSNVILSKSRSIIPYQNTSTPTSNDETPRIDKGNNTTTTTNNNNNNSKSATMSFECDYMTTFVNIDTGLAREHVYDPGYIDPQSGWTFSTKYTNEIVHLINTPAEMIGEDMEVTSLLSNFQIQPDQNDPNYSSYGTSLITRRLTRGIVLDCFKNLQLPSRTYAITGNRGIGKSYTLIFALQQALLYNKMCVIFFLQKQQKAILCIRNQERVYAWEGTTIHNIATSSLFTNPNVFVLVDPLDAEDGGINYAIGARRLIYAASNHLNHFNKQTPTKHWYKSHQRPAKKYRTDKQRFLSPPTEEELRIALPYMLNVNNTTFDEAIQRTYVVGMIPKYVLNNSAYEERKHQVEQYIQLLQSDSNEMNRLLNWNGMIGAHIPTIQTTKQQASTDETKNESQSSATVSINEMIDDDLDKESTAIGQMGPSTSTEMPQQRRPKSTPKPGTTGFYKMGDPLPNHIDGSIVLSLNALETVDPATPFGIKVPRSTTKMIGYNGDHQRVRYNHPKMTITAPIIYDTIIQHYKKVNPSYIVALWDKVGSGYHNGMKECISDLFWEFVLHQRDRVDQLPKNTSLMEQRNVLHRWKSYKLNKGRENMNHFSEWHIPIAMKGRNVVIDRSSIPTKRYPLYELKELFRSKRNMTPQLIRMDTNAQNIIHFAGPGRVVYQIVNDDNFTIDYKDMVKILANGKYLLCQQKVTKQHGTIVCVRNPPIEKLEWYFIVPTSSRCDVKWSQRSPIYYEVDTSTTSMTKNLSTQQRNERRLLNRDKEEVNICIKNNVIQYVLVMDLGNKLYNMILGETRKAENPI